MSNLKAVSSQVSLLKATATKIGVAFPDLPSNKTANAIVRGTGSVTATIAIMGSNLPDDDSFIQIGTITLSGTNSAADGLVPDSKWSYCRMDLTAITGTNASVDAAFGA